MRVFYMPYNPKKEKDNEEYKQKNFKQQITEIFYSFNYQSINYQTNIVPATQASTTIIKITYTITAARNRNKTIMISDRPTMLNMV